VRAIPRSPRCARTGAEDHIGGGCAHRPQLRSGAAMGRSCWRANCRGGRDTLSPTCTAPSNALARPAAHRGECAPCTDSHVFAPRAECANPESAGPMETSISSRRTSSPGGDPPPFECAANLLRQSGSHALRGMVGRGHGVLEHLYRMRRGRNSPAASLAGEGYDRLWDNRATWHYAANDSTASAG